MNSLKRTIPPDYFIHSIVLNFGHFQCKSCLTLNSIYSRNTKHYTIENQFILVLIIFIACSAFVTIKLMSLHLVVCHDTNNRTIDSLLHDNHNVSHVESNQPYQLVSEELVTISCGLQIMETLTGSVMIDVSVLGREEREERHVLKYGLIQREFPRPKAEVFYLFIFLIFAHYNRILL